VKLSLNEETVALYLKSIEDCYLKELPVNIISIEEDGYVLDRTIMHYEGGGQPGDRGQLLIGDNEVQIFNVIKRKNRIVHLAKEIVEGKEGILRLDWERRYEIMKMHTLQHAISALLYDKHGIRTIKSEVYKGYGEIFLDKEIYNLEDDFYRINEMARNVKRYSIQKENLNASLLKRCNLERLPKSLTKVSIVEIDGIDKCACAGTHVKNTSEIGKYWLRAMGKKLEFGKF
jgi:Predicted metal-dependent hydrolases related to alanyl-tRNA synthetase HxxxH domain